MLLQACYVAMMVFVVYMILGVCIIGNFIDLKMFRGHAIICVAIGCIVGIPISAVLYNLGEIPSFVGIGIGIGIAYTLSYGGAIKKLISMLPNAVIKFFKALKKILKIVFIILLIILGVIFVYEFSSMQ